MQERESATDATLERDLRRLLRARADSAPMPAGLADIPRGWLSPADRPTRQRAARAPWLIAAAVVLVLVATQLPRALELGRRIIGSELTAETAAAHLGVAAGQVVMTRDGAVGLRLVDGFGPRAQLLLVTSSGPDLETEVLTEVPVPDALFDANSVVVWSEQLSCAPERGLQQPNFLFGAVTPVERAPAPITVTAPAQVAQEGRLFVAAFDDADLTDVMVRLGVDGQTFDERPGRFFDRDDSCNGQPPRPHG